MITRFNKQLGTSATSHRKHLGEVIAYLREQRGHNHRMVSRVCGMPLATVEAMERGEHVPTYDQWNKLKRAVNRTLAHYGDLYRLACEERDTEQAANAAKETNVQNNGAPRHAPHSPSIGTNLGSKLGTLIANETAAAHSSADAKEAALDAHGYGGGDKAPGPITGLAVPSATVQAAPVDKPKRDTANLRESLAKLPDGWKARDQIERRKAFALEQLRLRPGIRTTGADSLDTLLQRTFGVGLSASAVAELRAQVERERIEAERQRIRAEVLTEVAAPAPAPEPKPERVIEQLPHERTGTGEVSEDDLAAAVDLVLHAIPGLQTFTITVDEHGVASVDYQIRKVVVTTAGGSLKVPRRG